jgi:cell division protein FtsL
LHKDRIKRSRFSYGSQSGILKRERSFYFKFFMILILLIFLSGIYIWQRVVVLSLEKEIKRANVRIGRLQTEYKYLQVDVASLSSVERIERLAQGMGFVCPSGKQGFLTEAPDSVILKKPSWTENLWVKIKGIKREMLSGEGVQAKEAKPSDSSIE